MYIYMCKYTYMNTLKYAFAKIRTYVHVYTCIYMHVYIFMYLFIYLHIHTHSHIQTLHVDSSIDIGFQVCRGYNCRNSFFLDLGQ